MPFKQTQTVPLTSLNFSYTLFLLRFFINFLGIGTPGVSSLLHATETARLSMPPSRLQILAAAFSTMTVTWSPPLDTMGYPLLSYQLEISSGRPLAGSFKIEKFEI